MIPRGIPKVIIDRYFKKVLEICSWPAFTCLKSTKEIPEQILKFEGQLEKQHSIYLSIYLSIGIHLYIYTVISH